MSGAQGRTNGLIGFLPIAIGGPPANAIEDSAYFACPKMQLEVPGSSVSLVTLHLSQLEFCSVHPEEEALLQGNVAEKRRSEFALGRAAARLALIEQGFTDPPPVLKGTGREPAWPEGIVGSITHCGPWAIAAVANDRSVWALGIDLEDIDAVPHNEIGDIVCSEAERGWVFGGRDTRLRLAMLFSAKEATYKALFPLCRKFFDFHDADLTWFPQRGCFLGKLCTDLSPEFPKGFSIEVDCRRRANFVFTRATIEAHNRTTADEQESSA